MKNKSILYRFGIVVLVVLLLVLILPSSRIDLSSSLSACSQMTVRTEKITSFASGDDLQYRLLSMDDAEYGQLTDLLSQVTFRKKLNQEYSSYSHDYPAQSVTLSGYDDAENHQLLLTVYSDGVHPEQRLCLGQYPRRRGRRAVSGADGDRGINRSFLYKTKIGARRWSSCTSCFCFLCTRCGTNHTGCRAGGCRANHAAASF